MSIQQRIRSWLGITEIQKDQAILNRKISRIDSVMYIANNKLDTIIPGLGRAIAKLDPQYGRSEFDPKRKAESDKLADEVIARLIAEHKVSNP